MALAYLYQRPLRADCNSAKWGQRLETFLLLWTHLQEAGFSVPVETQFCHAPLFEIYARLRDHTPIIRIEIMNNASEQEVKSTLNKLRYSVAGYPYCLKLAHNTCKITNEDIDRLASIYGLQNEQGARDVLNE